MKTVKVELVLEVDDDTDLGDLEDAIGNAIEEEGYFADQIVAVAN